MTEDQKYINIIEFSNKKLTVKPLDACRLFINASNFTLNTETNDDGEIMSVLFDGSQKICLNDRLIVKIGIIDSRYDVKKIMVDEDEKNVILFSSLPTKTSTFLLPVLNRSKLQLRYDTYFSNAFLDADLKHICLLYRFTGTELYEDFEQSIMSEKLFSKKIGYDPYHSLYIFRLPEEFETDIKHFLDGKYSKFSDKLKDMIFRFYGSNNDTIVCQVINKAPKLKELIEKDLGVELDSDMELASRPDMKDEIIRI